MEKGGVWLRRWVVLLGLYLATAEDKGVELGPRLPGDPKYWLRLKGISFSEGHLEPAFDGKLHDFQLKVANPAVRSFTMTIRLELQHYDLLALPKILVNGKALEYSPLNAIVVPVFMNDTISKEDKVVTITLEDPSGKKFGGFLGIGGKTRSHDYNIRCLQPPEFQKVVTINSLEVKLQNGKPMTPDKTDNTTGQYWYTLPASATGAYLKALCGKYSTSMTVNGVTVNSGSDFWIEMMVPHVTWLVECRYEDARWAQAAVGRTYQVHMNHLQDNFEPPTVRLMPQNGLCQEDEDVEGGVYCRCAHRSNLQLITTFQETSVEVFLKTGLHEQNLLSGIPTMVSLPSSNTHWKLLVKGMKTVEVPLRMVVAERCHGLTCPNGWVPRPALNGGEDAAIHLCYSEHCNMEDDGSTCCREAGTPCEEYSWDCGEGLEFFERGFCKGTPCEQTLDRKYCCIPKYDDEDAVQKGEQFNMKKGQWWKWFKKTDQHAETVVEELGDRVEFLTTLELKNKSAAPCFSKALESLVKEKFGVKKNAVKVSHFSGPPKDVPGAPKHEMENSDDMETFEVQVLNFEGPEKEQQLLDMVKGFIEGNGGASLTQALEEKKQCGSQKLQAKFTSKVEGVRAPRPTIDVKMVMEISKSADLGKGGGGEELAPEVQAALREAILSLAEIPDKEHIKLNFKKITSGEGIPEDDELVAIKGRIELPPGKEGSKQILASKLRNPSRVGRKMNKVLLKDVEKAEEDPNSRIIGGKKDYKVSSVDVVGVSGSPKDLGFKETASPEKILRAWLGLTTTTTTTVNVDGAALLRAANGQCIQAPRSRELGLRPIIEKCNHNDGHQAWFYTHSKHTLQSFMGLCLAADLNGPHPIPGVQDYRSDTHPGILQSWIQQGGPTQAHLWACNAHWQQAFIYNQKTGQMKIAGSSNPGMCLQTQGKSLVVALCKNTAHGAAFMQQFWLEKSRAEPFLPTHVSSALDLPIFVKPYFDGKVALKSSDSTYDTFKIAPFSQKRAAFYLTQGCSPVPTASCGTPVPDMPNVYVGQSLVKVSQKVDKLPWMSAFRGPQKNSGLTMCVYDPECKRADSRADRIQQFLHGCNAGGKPMCRYCGGNNPGQYGECPKWFDCANGGLEAGTWSKEHRQWCCEKFSEGCDAPYNCVEDLAKWRDWEGPKKMWCCAYQMVACEDECKKKNPALFRENHDYWCSTFGKEESEAQPAKSGPSPFELMVMQIPLPEVRQDDSSPRRLLKSHRGLCHHHPPELDCHGSHGMEKKGQASTNRRGRAFGGLAHGSLDSHVSHH